MKCAGAVSIRSDEARERFLNREGKPFLLSDWERALFLHFEVDAATLQRCVPLALDLFAGRAFVSLVAFTMCGMRPAWGGRAARWLFAPFAEQRFLNLRTYVRHQWEGGIYFLAEWMSHRLLVPLGPRVYGLPYRWGRFELQHDHERGVVSGRVAERRGGAALEYAARPANGAPSWRFAACEEGSFEEFLLERYVAFTQQGRQRRFFRIWHEPWQKAAAEVEVAGNTLLRGFVPWWREARFVGANYSPGVFGVWMGKPRRCC
jgi:hypothetical protein